ncbi:TadE/TadG family type IV pilus assembly protein [Sphingobium cloacae]|uniref:Flp pilus assembly protein TadG n=1 Tax=Sphingobium cloacae TaxID=120107 RepID=A0A1E1F0W2_9SPHN|nr:Tad domain-containing protein [Sphingobium cloacae]BAV64147.1 Flp pilus assembly protein TadG [Sphingobium cloacae]
MSKKAFHSASFLGRLRRDASGNTLAIVAAAIIPLSAMIGGSIDISRLYLTKTRLQQACDAGALAGRKDMSGITWTDANKTVAEQFFRLNFPEGRYGTGTSSIDFTASSAGAVTGAAVADVPMTLMSLFNMPTRTIHAECTADLQLPNTDVMFVLDTTLSMNDANPGDSQSRIVALREAVSSFYTQLQQVKPAGSHIRYGFVPYSGTVNVGMLLKRDWIVDSWTYDSREANGTTQSGGDGVEPDTTTSSSTKKIKGNTTSSTAPGLAEKCTGPTQSNDYSEGKWSDWSAWTPSDNALPRSHSRQRTRVGTTYSYKLNNGVCTITSTTYSSDYVEEQTETIKKNPNAGKPKGTTTNYNWSYKAISYPLTSLKGTGDGNELVSGGSFEAQVEDKHQMRPITWTESNACIEERKTRRTSEGEDTPRNDMDVDLVPDKDHSDTQWRPFLPGLVYGRNNTSFTATGSWKYTTDAPTNTATNYLTPFKSPDEYGACPSPARKLAEIDDASTLTTYLSTLKPKGFTYHDIGFLWGLRLMSRDGIFREENRAAEATGRVARHLIFMTDGDTDTRIGAYDAWGLSAIDRRRTPIGSIPTNIAQNAITEDRLRTLCTLAKNDKNITVWVIAFGTDLTTLLSDCASPGRAYQADNASQLTATFSQIASQIAQLRVTR